MGLDNPLHIAFLLVLMLLVFGAKRLPEMGRSLGAGMRGFKDSLSGEHVRHTVSAQQHEPVAVANDPTPPPALTAVAQPVAAPVEEPGTPSAA